MDKGSRRGSDHGIPFVGTRIPLLIPPYSRTETYTHTPNRVFSVFGPPAPRDPMEGLVSMPTLRREDRQHTYVAGRRICSIYAGSRMEARALVKGSCKGNLMLHVKPTKGIGVTWLRSTEGHEEMCPEY